MAQAPAVLTLVVPARYEGPPGSANGGLASGLIAQAMAGGGACEVTLRAPVPLGRPLLLEPAADGRVRVLEPDGAGGAGGPLLVAEARPLPLPPLAVPHVTRAEADAAPSPADHPHDRCFVCGTHTPGGIRFHPRPGRRDPAAAPAAGEPAAQPRRLWVAPFDAPADLCAPAGGPGLAVPGAAPGEPVLRPEIAWGVLDCSGSWAPTDRRPPWSMRTGRLHGALHAPVRPGERCVVMAWSLGRAAGSRRHLVASALLGEDGGLRAAAVATWILPRPGEEELRRDGAPEAQGGMTAAPGTLHLP